jgi:hypothetical protein
VSVYFTDSSGNRHYSTQVGVIDPVNGSFVIAFTPIPRTTTQFPPPAQPSGPQNSNIGVYTDPSVGSSCTAELVGPSVILTAAHCIGNGPGLFIPGFRGNLNNACSGTCETPYGVYVSTTHPLVPSAYIQGNQGYDFAYVVLDTDPSGRPAEALPGGTPVLFNDTVTSWRIVGYQLPDTGGSDFYQRSCAADGNLVDNHVTFINCVAAPSGVEPEGTSGGPWFDGSSVVAINKAGGRLCSVCQEGEYGTRLTDATANGQSDPSDAASLFRQALNVAPNQSSFTAPAAG